MQWIKASDKLPWHRAHWNTGKLGADDNSFPVRIGDFYSIGDIYDQRQEGNPEVPMIKVRGKGDMYADQFHLIEWLDESSPASAVEEAARLYPYFEGNDMTIANAHQDMYRIGHITCAGMYTGEIEKGREAVDILKALCALKKHKDTVGKDEYYEKAQPEVWKIANKFLEKL